MQLKLRVAIDGYNLSLLQGTGVATYARNLSRILRLSGAEVYPIYGKKFPRSKDIPDEIGFFDSFRVKRRGLAQRGVDLAGDLVGSIAMLGGSNVTARSIKLSGIVDTRQIAGMLPEWDGLLNIQGGYEAAEIAFLLRRRLVNMRLEQAVDVFHSTYPLPIGCRDAVQVCTIHDLVPLILPFTTLDHKASYGGLIRRIIEHYDLIFTVSESTKRDLIKLFDVPDKKIWVTWQGVTIPDRYLGMSDSDTGSYLKSAYDLSPKGYVLFVGAIEPKKNVGRLLEAYMTADVDLPLVLVGKKGWLYKNEIRLLGRSGKRNSKVIRIPYAAFETLVRLYRGARALIFPSLYEGFGLPPLEAMLLGCPVITSNQSSLPEVCGDAALYVDPYDVNDIAAAIRTIVSDDKLCADLIEKGYRQGRMFSVEKYQQRLMEGYSIALGKSYP